MVVEIRSIRQHASIGALQLQRPGTAKRKVPRPGARLEHSKRGAAHVQVPIAPGYRDAVSGHCFFRPPRRAGWP